MLWAVGLSVGLLSSTTTLKAKTKTQTVSILVSREGKNKKQNCVYFTFNPRQKDGQACFSMILVSLKKKMITKMKNRIIPYQLTLDLLVHVMDLLFLLNSRDLASPIALL